MRRIRVREFLTFCIITLLCIVGSVLISNSIYYYLKNQSIKFDLLSVILFLTFLYLFLIFSYRLFLFMCPLEEGEIKLHSRMEYIYHVYILFFLFYFYPVIFSGIIPVPYRRMMYRILGAKIDFNTYPSGIIFDPVFITIGKNAIIGAGSKLIPHVMEGTRLAHYPIVLGDNVTIGVNSTILGGCKIADNAIIAAHSLVPKNTIINNGEIWAGTPAKKIK